MKMNTGLYTGVRRMLVESLNKSNSKINIGLWLWVAVTLICDIYLIADRLVFIIFKHETGIIVGVIFFLVAVFLLSGIVIRGIKRHIYFFCRTEAVIFIIIFVFAVFLAVYRKDYSAEYVFQSILWVVSGMLFLELIIHNMDSRDKILWGVVFLFLFISGYPLSNLLYGCKELGAAINSVMAAMHVVRHRKKKSEYNICDYLIIIVGIIGFVLWFQQGLIFILIAVSPMLFGKFKHNKLKGWISGVFVIFAFLAGYLFILTEYGSEAAYYNIYNCQKAAVYSNLWSDAGIFLFLIILYFYSAIKKKKIKKAGFYACALIIGYIFPLVYAVNNSRNSFDGYNLFYILWVWIVYVSVEGFFMNYRSMGIFIKAYMTVIVCVFLFMLSGAEQKLQDLSIWYCVDIKADSYLKVYVWNIKSLEYNQKNISDEMREIYQVCSELVEKSGQYAVIPCMAEDNVFYLESFYKETGQQMQWRNFYRLQPVLLNSGNSQADVWEKYILKEYAVPYVMVEKGSDLYWYGIGIYENLEVVFENDYGFVFSIPHNLIG